MNPNLRTRKRHSPWRIVWIGCLVVIVLQAWALTAPTPHRTYFAPGQGPSYTGN